MGALEIAFAATVTVLAAVCVILALVVAAYWLAVQARRLRAQLRRPPEPWWHQRGAVVPAVPEHERELIVAAARRILAGEGVRAIRLDSRP